MDVQEEQPNGVDEREEETRKYLDEREEESRKYLGELVSRWVMSYDLMVECIYLQQHGMALWHAQRLAGYSQEVHDLVAYREHEVHVMRRSLRAAYRRIELLEEEIYDLVAELGDDF